MVPPVSALPLKVNPVPVKTALPKPLMFVTVKLLPDCAERT
jgi:hypothetical protein